MFGWCGLPELSETLEAAADKCTSPSCCCGLCSALRPRWKRLVDNIYPVNQQDGLVKSNMAKLTNYVRLSPEKLDRIGEYLETRVSRDIYRRRTGSVLVSVEAMDTLVSSCPPNTLNLFVESFLKTVQRLLECEEPQMQVLATQSFVKFSNIAEDTPSYHRRYDFFVSKFASMCHSAHSSPATRLELRMAGLEGLQGVIKKTVSDDLVENIWTEAHMEKIIPSLLFNMDQNNHQPAGPTGETAPSLSEQPPQLAETCLRELVGRASYAHIRRFMKPVLRHLDNHGLWVPNQFAVETFKVIMFSIPAQHSYAVIQLLMTHLDEKARSEAPVRTGIADVLAKIITIAAGECVGPSVLEIINSVLSHLRQSVTTNRSAGTQKDQRNERQYQEALINALGEFANNLPDYQKIEIMMFIMGKVPQYPGDRERLEADSESEVLLQNMLLRSLLKVGTKYTSLNLATTFPLSFLDPLMRMSLAPDPEIRLLVQRILHTLIDRRGNLARLDKPRLDITQLDLQVHKCSRQDVMFIKRNGPEMLLCLLESLELANNSLDNLTAIYTTLALLWLEVNCPDFLPDVLRLTLDMQEIALNSEMSQTLRINLHILAITFANFVSSQCSVPALYQYVKQVVSARRERSPHLLPDLTWHYDPTLGREPPDACLLLDQARLTEVLTGHGLDASRLQTPFSNMMPSSASVWQKRQSILQGSERDLNNITVEVDSMSSSIGLFKPKPPPEHVCFEAMKQLVRAPPEEHRAEQEEERQRLTEACRSLSLHALAQQSNAGVDTLRDKLDEIFSQLGGAAEGVGRATTVYTPPSLQQIQFPELFVY
ncbi:LOW QUALITY PROTEIN: protein EFR3 homolog cmp44E-like [Pollicipes pollicipes]|uniref:LOW QUALITY PROTEIN: protein EFR3 homolog cmp44E-like n=1 Tax=Pollicipes pollicipes TaxID=41117 RepID=UPI0018850C9D|nr:LOW QUALITY PROTEIN: protein EFR3 homolog cmp44E-like [Pollicipes pollicipes]